MENEPKRPNLLKALLAAQRAATAVPKDSETKGGAKYRYTSAEVVTAEGGRWLNEAGLVLLVLNNQVSDRLLTTHYLVAHPESGEELILTSEMPIVEGQGRGLDKAVFAAATNDKKMMLLALLLLPREEMVDNRDDTKKPAGRITKAKPKVPAMRKVEAEGLPHNAVTDGPKRDRWAAATTSERVHELTEEEVQKRQLWTRLKEQCNRAGCALPEVKSMEDLIFWVAHFEEKAEPGPNDADLTETLNYQDQEA